jgi:hypothetical protein
MAVTNNTETHTRITLWLTPQEIATLLQLLQERQRLWAYVELVAQEAMGGCPCP